MMPRESNAFVRCQYVCPHGDQCRHPAGHDQLKFSATDIDVGCTHKNCFCNEANAWQRPTWDETFMAMARVISLRGTCDRLRVGAVIVQSNRVIASGYNGAPTGWGSCDEVGHQLVQMGERTSCVRTIHAEENAILMCSLHGVNPTGATIYTTASACYDCFKRIAQVGILDIVYTDEYNSARNHGVDMADIVARQGIRLRHMPLTIERHIAKDAIR